MANQPTILASTWDNGLFVLDGDEPSRMFVGRSVRGLSSYLDNGAIAIVDGKTLVRRTVSGKWETIATSELELACTLAVDQLIYVGTDDARILRLDSTGRLEQIDDFDTISGRDTWLAGTAIVDGKEVGPPLGIRSMSATCDGEVLLANVHVGGIPRSTDGGETWQPSMDVNFDAHEVLAHPTIPNLVVAATATGFCISWDAGASWELYQEGLHAPYCSAVAITGDDILVAASTSHFSPDGALYRRAVEQKSGPLFKIESGLPPRLGGIVDTACIATQSVFAALVDQQGNLYLSEDRGQSWSRNSSNIPRVSSLIMV